jgi:hypothetical protein
VRLLTPERRKITRELSRIVCIVSQAHRGLKNLQVEVEAVYIGCFIIGASQLYIPLKLHDFYSTIGLPSHLTIRKEPTI